MLNDLGIESLDAPKGYRMNKQARLFENIEKSAWISDCRRYRHRLDRHWNRALGFVLFVGLNPSTADAEKDDPTIRRCVNFAESWSYGGMVMGNLFDWRSTDPKSLPALSFAVSEKNDSVLRCCILSAKIVVAAWGKVPWADGRIEEVFGTVFRGDKSWHCLGLTKDRRYPRHPLYVRKDATPTVFW